MLNDQLHINTDAEKVVFPLKSLQRIADVGTFMARCAVERHVHEIQQMFASSPYPPRPDSTNGYHLCSESEDLMHAAKDLTAMLEFRLAVYNAETRDDLIIEKRLDNIKP